jgi:hypothetical protein
MNEESILKHLIVLDHFIAEATCQNLVRAYQENSLQLNMRSSNKLVLEETLQARYPNMYLAFIKILARVRDLIRVYYSTKAYLDDAALFARIVGNKCEFHSDNLVLHCPTHGRNQAFLRDVNCSCPDATYIPNHTGWRDYTSLLYLDSNHKGGDIIFQDGPVSNIYRKQIEAIVGRLIVCPAGRFYYHETTPVTEGTRYSLNMWFTCDKTKAFFEQNRASFL